MLTGSYGYESVREQSGYEPMPVLLTPSSNLRIVVIPGLATEIGGHPQQVLNQVQYRITQHGKFVDGRYWAHASAKMLHEKMLPHLSENYIDDILRELEERGILDSRKDLNRLAFDRTKWYALNIEGVGRLESVVLGWQTPETTHAEPVDQAPSRDLSAIDPGNPGMDSGEESPFPESRAMQSTQSVPSESTQSVLTITKNIKKETVDQESIGDDDGLRASVSSSSANGQLDDVVAEITQMSPDNKQVRKAAYALESEKWITPEAIAFWAKHFWPEERPSNAERMAPWPGQVQQGVKRDGKKLLEAMSKAPFWDEPGEGAVDG